MKRNTVVQRTAGWRAVIFLIAVGAWVGLAPSHAVGASDPAPCSAKSESRQLDYWLGDWQLTSPEALAGNTSHVSLALGNCLFVENWDNGKGHTGENIFAYSPDDKSWHGMFADNEGRVHVFVDGQVAGGSAEFYGPNRGPDGTTVLNRVKLVRLTPDKIEHSWEKSTDNGVSWTTVFRGEYSRRNLPKHSPKQ